MIAGKHIFYIGKQKTEYGKLRNRKLEKGKQRIEVNAV